MCRLFGATSEDKLGLEFSFLEADKPFRSLCTGNPDGWGIGYYPGPEVYKEAVSACESSSFVHKAHSVESSMVLAHVRRATVGEGVLRNTQPFRHGDWLFVHQGTIDIRDEMVDQLKQEHGRAIDGETDSEVYFHLLLQNIEEKGIVDGLSEAVGFVNERRGDDTTSLNFILADGENLYAYRQSIVRDGGHTLFYTSPQDFTRHKSSETGLCIDCSDGEGAVVVASEKLTESDWTSMENGELVTVSGGVEVTVTDIV